MEEMRMLFAGLSRAIEGAPLAAAAAAFVWGVLSILLSPCHLASIPLVVGFIDEQGAISTKRAFWISLLFSTGILITIALVGLATALAGRMMGDVGTYGNYLVAAVFFVVGLHLMDIMPLKFAGPGRVNMKRKGLLAAFILGLVFGVALGPCTFAFMAPMLAMTFKMSASHGVYGAFLLLMYGAGHCGVIVLAGTSYEWIEHYLKWNGPPGARSGLKKSAARWSCWAGFGCCTPRPSPPPVRALLNRLIPPAFLGYVYAPEQARGWAGYLEKSSLNARRHGKVLHGFLVSGC